MISTASMPTTTIILDIPKDKWSYVEPSLQIAMLHQLRRRRPASPLRQTHPPFSWFRSEGMEEVDDESIWEDLLACDTEGGVA